MWFNLAGLHETEGGFDVSRECHVSRYATFLHMAARTPTLYLYVGIFAQKIKNGTLGGVMNFRSIFMLAIFRLSTVFFNKRARHVPIDKKKRVAATVTNKYRRK